MSIYGTAEANVLEVVYNIYMRSEPDVLSDFLPDCSSESETLLTVRVGIQEHGLHVKKQA